MKRVVPWLLTFIVCTPNVLSGVETVNALTRDKKEQTKIFDVKFSKDAIHSQEKMDLSFKIEKPKESPLERTYSIPKDIEHSLIPTKSKYVIKQKKKEVGEIRFKKDKMMVQWKQDTAQQKIETDCTLEVKAHYYNDEEEINKVKIGKEVTKILPATEPLEDENLLIQDIHDQPLERKKENQVFLDLKWPVTTELKEGNQYVFKLPKWMEAKKQEISFKDEDKKNWFEAKIEKERITLKILKGKVYDPTVYRLPIVFRVNANQNEKVVQWMKRAIPLQKKSVAMDEIDTAAVDTTKETKEEHKQSSVPDSEPSSTREKTRSVSLTSDSADDATSTTTTDIQDAIILSHQEVKEGATEQEEIKIRTVEELLQKSQRIRRSIRSRNLNHTGVVTSIVPSKTELMDGEQLDITVNFNGNYGEIQVGDRIEITLPDNSDISISAYPGKEGYFTYGGKTIGKWWVDSSHRVIAEFNQNIEEHWYANGSFTFPCKVENKHRDPNGNTSYVDTSFGTSAPQSHISVTVPESTPSKSPFYYKAGQMSIEKPNKVQWWLNGNVNQEQLIDNVFIRDQVQEGHIIDWNSMYIYFTGGPLHGQTFSVDEFNNSQYGYIQKVSNIEFNIIISPWVIDPWGRWIPQTGNFTVSYETFITNPNQKAFENHSQICYRTPSESKDWEEEDATVQNIFSDSNIVLGDRDILLQKVDEKDHKKKLSGAEFILKQTNGHQKVYQGITDKNGNLVFRNILPGLYTLQETKAPDGYELDHTVYELYITEKGVKFKTHYSQVVEENGKKFTITNKKKSENIGPKLPNTGGDGYKKWFILVAYTLILGTMILYIYNKKGTHTQ